MEQEVRLIDANKLKNHYAWWEIGDGEITYAEAKKRFDTIIDVQPTVEQPQTNATENVTERHGHWIHDYDLGCTTCSECGDHYLWEDFNGPGGWNYCPNCGAKMDAPTQKIVGNALEALEATDETNSMKPYRDEEGHWAIDSNPYRTFEQYAKERDFVEVVRCKDCIHSGQCTKEIVMKMRVGSYLYCPMGNEGFCSHGERKENAKEE